ncbi:MAG TPA: hypothetical protein VGN90_03905 [Pyrinomonadaceae bacterium]|jgi:hypothetical protein|nr:hypothetical protein [Pyrinomonadaceae bacterium]
MSEENQDEIIEIYDDDNVEIYDASVKAIRALYALAASPKPLPNRIINAYLALVHIRDNTLTEALLEEYQELIAHMTRRRTIDSPVRATIEAMNEEELQDAAGRIIRFYEGIRKESFRRRFERREF